MNYLQKKKLAFMSIVNQIKGFIRTVSGIFPLTLPNCVDDKSITKYLIYGNSVQNGTPTPDNPVEVESVGERTKNLFNPSKLTGGDGFVEYNGVQCYSYVDTAPDSGRNFKYIDEFKENAQYTLAIRVYTANEKPYTGINFKYTDGTKKTLYVTNSNDIQTFTTEANKTLQSIAGGQFSGVYCYIDLTVTQLEEGTIATEYEPYGYKIPITVSGKNLFNVNTYGEVLDKYDNTAAFDISKLDVGTMITISTKDEYYYKISDNAGGVGTYLYKANKYTFTLTQAHINLGFIFLINTKTFNPETKENLLTQNVQIEYGPTATDYEPYKEPISTVMYLDEPLYYADYIDFENGKVVRNVGKSQYDENYNFEVYYLNSTYCGFYRFQTDMKKGYRLAGFCNYLQNRAAYDSDVWLGVNTRVVYLFFRDIYNSAETDSERVQNFKDWLANLETPLYVYYPLATPTETPIALPNIPTHKGTSIITVGTTIQPSNAEVTYYSTLKE